MKFISAAPIADFAIVIAITDPEKGASGITALLVEAASEGYALKDEYLPMSGQYLDADIHFKNVRVPKENVLGGVGKGFALGMGRINANRLLHCPSMLGLARNVFERSVTHAQGREQFGRPIGHFQAIQHMLADMATGIFACEAMIMAAAKKADRGEDIRQEASMCKSFVSETCFQIADKAVQIHGSVGLTKGHPVEWTFRMLRMWRVLTGTTEIQKNTIAKAILSF